MGSDQVKIVYSQRQGCKNISGFLASKMATWSLPNTFLQWFYWFVDTSIIYLLAYLYNIAVKAWIYHSMSQNCLERDRSMPNRLSLLVLPIELRPSWALLVPWFLSFANLHKGRSNRLKYATFGDISEFLSTSLLVPMSWAGLSVPRVFLTA